MQSLVFASANAGKVAEVSAKLGHPLCGLGDIGCTAELPETTGTLEGNAAQKAHYIWEHFGCNCFADDTGLEVDALYGIPGVNSAHYAGPQRSAEDNMRKLLREMEGEVYRTARFRTVIHLIWRGQHLQFQGICRGTIIHQPRGSYGFGYDPIFIPMGTSRTFAEMSLAEKNIFSHRARAIESLRLFLLSARK